jgi:hypothetical protein
MGQRNVRLVSLMTVRQGGSAAADVEAHFEIDLACDKSIVKPTHLWYHIQVDFTPPSFKNFIPFLGKTLST